MIERGARPEDAHLPVDFLVGDSVIIGDAALRRLPQFLENLARFLKRKILAASEAACQVADDSRIGAGVARIMTGFGCRVLGHDLKPDPACVAMGVTYVALPELLASSDIVTLHCPLMPDNRHLIDAAAIAGMKRGAMLVNTSRGAIIDTQAVIDALKTGIIGHLGLDVYEEEGNLFFEDMSERVIGDDVFSRLLTFPNVLVTGHQGFFTHEAMTAIGRTTFDNIAAYEATGHAVHEVA